MIVCLFAWSYAASEGGSCDAHLSCARDSAKRGGAVVDHKNVCGAVCAHGVPIKRLFLSSTANENFLQYVVILAVARQVGCCWSCCCFIRRAGI